MTRITATRLARLLQLMAIGGVAMAAGLLALSMTRGNLMTAALDALLLIANIVVIVANERTVRGAGR